MVILSPFFSTLHAAHTLAHEEEYLLVSFLSCDMSSTHMHSHLLFIIVVEFVYTPIYSSTINSNVLFVSILRILTSGSQPLCVYVNIHIRVRVKY